MKSGRGVIAYRLMGPFLFICEGDTENETLDSLNAILKNPDISGQELASRVESKSRRRGREIGDLWR